MPFRGSYNAILNFCRPSQKGAANKGKNALSQKEHFFLYELSLFRVDPVVEEQRHPGSKKEVTILVSLCTNDRKNMQVHPYNLN